MEEIEIMDWETDTEFDEAVRKFAQDMKARGEEFDEVSIVTKFIRHEIYRRRYGHESRD